MRISAEVRTAQILAPRLLNLSWMDFSCIHATTAGECTTELKVAKSLMVPIACSACASLVSATQRRFRAPSGSGSRTRAMALFVEQPQIGLSSDEPCDEYCPQLLQRRLPVSAVSVIKCIMLSWLPALSAKQGGAGRPPATCRHDS